MMGFGLLALIANVWCLSLIAKHRNGKVPCPPIQKKKSCWV